MFDDDEDESDSQSRYPSIPSLVALQLMKNRLQLANLGRKLMKWSSMATGKELRKRAGEISREFQHYGEQVANAYLLLARARFYNPEINKHVLQNVGRNAACVVEFENRTLIGVRFFQMTLIERNHDPNLHLGLEKGGEAITAAKQAWRDLLREMILMLEYETAFQRIYVANKSSTKKQNVLGKVIIPKITNAIAYIKSELEEKEREETFRLKRFKYSKAKKVEREERARKFMESFQEPETIIEEPEIIEEPKTIEEVKTIEDPKKVEEPAKIEEVENIEEPDILAELGIFEEPDKIEEPETFEEPEKIEPKVMMLQIKTSKQKVIEPEIIVLETFAPEVTESDINLSEIFSDTAVSETKVAEVVQKVKLQEPDIFLPEFIIQGETSPLEKQKIFMPEIIFEGKPTKVAEDWDQFVKTTPFEDMTKTESTKQPMESAQSCPLCKAQTDDTNQRVLHLIEHVNKFLMLCKQNKIDFTKLETKGDKFNYKNIKKELELLSFSYSCPHKSLEERNNGDVGKISCLIQRPDGSYVSDVSKKKRGKEQESVYKCLSPQSSAMSYACKQTQIDDMTSNGSVTTLIPTNCKFSFNSQFMADAKYFEYCNWTPELTLQYYEKNQHHIYPSTSARREEDNYGTQTSTHSCKCPSGECSLSIKENQSPNPSNNSPYFKRSPTYYTSMPQTHYTSLNRNLKPYLFNKSTLNSKYFSHLLQNIPPMALFAPESRSGLYKISDLIYTSDWTNVIIPKGFATVATYQRSNFFLPYTEDLYDSYDTSDTFNSVNSSNTVIRTDSLTCMTVLPQGYPGVVPYMSRFGFTDVINNNPTNDSITKEYANINERQFCKGLVPYTPKEWPGPSRTSDDVSSVFFIANDSTSCSSDDTASISGISDTEINEDCVTCVVSQKNENSDINAHKEKANSRSLSQQNGEAINKLRDKHKNKNYTVYVILTPDQNWPFNNSYMRKQTHKKNLNNYQIDAEYQEQGRSSKTTRSSGTCKFKDYSVYVTLTPSQNARFNPSRREIGPGFDSANTTGTATYKDNATYVTTVKRKYKSGTSCTRCGKCVTKYITSSESTDPIQSRSGLSVVFDVNNVTATETVTYPSPYTREGRPGPSDVSEMNNGQFGRVPYTEPFEINITNSRPITSSTPFTREGKPGPFEIYEASNINTNKHIEPPPYTREGRPGPVDIAETSNVITTNTVTSATPYTREGRPGSNDISELKNIRTSVPFTRDGRLPNDISETRNSLATTLSTPKNQECGPGRCGVYSVVCVYTSEGTPRHCGLIEVCKNTCLNPCTSSIGRKCRPIGTSERDNNIAACISVTPCLPYTRERRSGPYNIAPTMVNCCTPNTPKCGPGRCGVYDVVSVYTSEGNPRHCGLIEICKNTCSNLCTSSNRKKGEPFDTSEINNIASCNSVTPCLPYTREIRSRPNNIAPTMISSCTSNTQKCGPGRCCVYDVVSVYTSEGNPRHCGLIEICKNTCSNLCTSFNGKNCVPFGTSEINNIAASNSVTPCLPYTREISFGPNNIAPTMVSSCTRNTQKCRPGRCGVYDVVSVYTSEGNPKHCGLIEICKNTCSNIRKCTASNIRKCGPLGTSEISNTAARNSVTRCLPYTRKGRHMPNYIYSDAPMTVACSKPNTQECGPGRCGVYSVVCVYTGEGEPKHCGLIEICKNPCSKPLVSSTNTRQETSGPCGTSEIGNITASQTVTCFLPYTREGKPVSGTTEANNIITTKKMGCVPYTRERLPGSFDISEMSNNTASKQVTPYTREGKPGPCGIFEMSTTTTTKQFSPVPYTREGRPGPFNISRMSNYTASKQVTPYTREGKPGPCGISEVKNITSTEQIGSLPYTREESNGPFDFFEMNNNTASKHVSPYTREGRPGPFEVNSNIASKRDESSKPYTQDGTPGPCGISETNDKTTTEQIYNNITAPKMTKSSAPYTRESITRPCSISEASNINGSFLSYQEHCEVYSIMCGYTREGKLGPCCNIKMNDITTPMPITRAPYTREGKPGPFSFSETNIITTYKQCEPVPYKREGRPGSLNTPEMNYCCRPNQMEPHIREDKPESCGILDESNIACSKYLTSCKPCKRNVAASNQFEPKPYTREGKPGLFDTYKTIGDRFKTHDALTTVVTPREYTREGRSEPFGLSEVRNVTSNKEIPDTTYYNVFMATTNPCQCGFNAPSTHKKTSSSETSDKSNQSCIETEYKKHTKNLRYKECDGTIVDEKRITIIKIKKRKPQKQDALEANKSTCISQNLENGTDLDCKCAKQSKSENIRSSPDVMPCPKMRTSISTQVLKTGKCTDKNSEDQSSSPNCGCGKEGTPRPSPEPVCTNKPEDSSSCQKCECGDKDPPKPSTIPCINKPEDSASGPKCDCGGGAPPKPLPTGCSNMIKDSDSSLKCDCGSGPKCECGGGAAAKPSSCACSKKPGDSAIGPKCECCEGATEKPFCACSKKPEDSAGGPKCNCGEGASAKPSSCACFKKPEDSASGQKCECSSGPKCENGEGASSKPSSCACSKKPKDSGPKCKCGDKTSPKPPPLVCANRLEDSASGPKCDCGEKASEPPTLVCANRLEDSASGPKCDCGENASKLPSLVCANRLEDSASGPKCDCGGVAPPKPPLKSILVCANRLEDSASGPKCDCGEKTPKPPPLVCANRLEDSASGPKCDCGDKASKPPPLVCANRLENSASGPKCDCGEKTSKPPSLVCANRLEDSASGPKCDCGAPPKPPPIPCPNKPKDSASEKCDCGGGASAKPSSCACSKMPEDSASGPKFKCDGGAPPPIPCPNKPKDSASGSKCDCGAPPVPCPNKPKDPASGSKCDCGAPPIPCPNKPKDSANDSKCKCGGGAPSKKTSSIACPNKPKESASSQKCDCGGGAPPPITCPNKPKDSGPKRKCGGGVSAKPSSCVCSKPEDSDSGPKCDCGGGAPSKKSSSIVCPNKPKESASSQKCDCGGGAPPKPPPIPCPNKLKDLASSQKCECGGGAPSKKLSSIACPNKPKESASSKKCDCGVGAPPPIPCPNKPKDSGPKCKCGGGASAKPSSCACFKPKDSASGSKCDCEGGAPSKKPSSIVCPNKPKDSASGPKCDCVGGAPPPIPCPNKPEDSGPKCKCGEGASAKPSSCACSKSKDSVSGPKSDCGGGAPSKKSSSIECPNKSKDSASASGPKYDCGGGVPPPIPCPNKPKDSASGPKCKCRGGASAKPSFCACSKPADSASGPKCDCGGGASSKKSSSIECPNKPKDSANGPECNCGGGAPSKKSSSIECPNKPKDSASSQKCECGAPPVPCPNKPKDSASGPKCECGAGGSKPKNSHSSCGQVSGNRVVDLTHGPKCECGDKSSMSGKKLKDSGSDAKCHCVKEPPLSFEPVCPNLSRGSKTSNVSKENSKTRNAPKCDCAKEAAPKPQTACGRGALANTPGCGNKVEETCQTGIPDYPLCACTGEALSKALLQKVLDTLRCQKAPLICAPPDKPDRHANCFKENSPSSSNKKQSCALCGSPLANKAPPTAKATCVCSDSSVHAPKSKTKKSNKNTTCGYCTFGRIAHDSNGQSNKICEIDNKNNRTCNLKRGQNDPVTKFCTSINKKKNDNDSFCTIKIITKSPRSRCCGTEYKNSLDFSTGTNTLEALRQLCRPTDHKINKNICETCYSPLTPSIGSEIHEKPFQLCEVCQDKLVQENERGYRCTTYGFESTSCRSPTEGSPTRSIYSQKTNLSARGCGNNCNK